MLQTPANPYNIRTFQLPCFAFFPFITPAAAAAKLLQSCPTLRDPIDGHRRRPTRLPHPWDSPGKNTGVGCHFLLQCIKVKSKSEVTQSCLTLSDPVDCSLPGSSIHGNFPGKSSGVGCHFITPSLLHISAPSNCSMFISPLLSHE